MTTNSGIGGQYSYGWQTSLVILTDFDREIDNDKRHEQRIENGKHKRQYDDQDVVWKPICLEVIKT